ncbi:MAG: hypothetical protein WAW52_08615 [Methanothrix sp.]
MIVVHFLHIVNLDSHFAQKSREAELLDTKSIDEILIKPAKLRAVKVGGIWKLDELKRAEFRIDTKKILCHNLPQSANICAPCVVFDTQSLPHEDPMRISNNSALAERHNR